MHIYAMMYSNACWPYDELSVELRTHIFNNYFDVNIQDYIPGDNVLRMSREKQLNPIWIKTY